MSIGPGWILLTVMPRVPTSLSTAIFSVTISDESALIAIAFTPERSISLTSERPRRHLSCM